MVELRLPVDRELVTWLPRVRTGTCRDGLKTGWIPTAGPQGHQPRLVHSSSIVRLEFDYLHVIALLHDYIWHLVTEQAFVIIGGRHQLSTIHYNYHINCINSNHLPSTHQSSAFINQSLNPILSCNPNAPFLLCGLAVHVLCAQGGPHMSHHSNA